MIRVGIFLCWFSAFVLVMAVGGMIVFLFSQGWHTVSFKLLFGITPPLQAIFGHAPVWDGIWPALVGTLYMVFISVLIAIPLGLGGGMYLSAYAHPRVHRLLGIGVHLLAGVPSIVMGLFGFTMILFLRRTLLPEANTCLFLASVCIALLILPYLVNATANALQTLPISLQLSGQALGLSRWQTLAHISLPAASKGILGGVILAIGRAAEDTAVILLTGVVANAGLPKGLFHKFEALPFHIYFLTSEYQTPQELELAFGSAIILLGLTSLMILLARMVHVWFEQQWKHE